MTGNPRARGRHAAVFHRPARETDLQRTYEVMLEAEGDLARGHHLDPADLGLPEQARALRGPVGCTAGLPGPILGCRGGGQALAMTRLAEAGCSEKTIASISGHQTLKEIARYTKAADQAMLAEAAIRAISGPEGEQKVANLDDELAKTDRKSLKKGA